MTELEKVMQEAAKASEKMTAPVRPKQTGNYLDQQTFDMVVHKINEVTRGINPSRSNGRLGEWVVAIKNMFDEIEVSEDLFVATSWNVKTSGKVSGS